MQKPAPTTATLAASSRINSLAVIRIGGADRISFLQGQLTQDMRLLAPDRPLLAGWTSAKGRLLCVVWLIDWQEAVWLVLPGELREKIAGRLKMYVLRSDVQIETPEVSVLCIAPSQPEQPEIPQNKPQDNPLTDCFYDDFSYSIYPRGRGGKGLQLQLAEPTAAPVADAIGDWRLQQIQSGCPAVYLATAEAFVPQMVNLDLLGGISFKKGCYVGQEIVARTQNLGRIKRRMFAFSTAAGSPAAPGQPVYCQGNSVGEVVDAAANGTGTALLAVIRLDYIAGPLCLTAAGEFPLERQPLPYAVPEAAV